MPPARTIQLAPVILGLALSASNSSCMLTSPPVSGSDSGRVPEGRKHLVPPALRVARGLRSSKCSPPGPRLTAVRPGRRCWISCSCSTIRSGGREATSRRRRRPRWWAATRVTAFAGSASASICSSLRPRTNPSGAEHLHVLLEKGRASAIAFSGVSATWVEKVTSRSSPGSVSRPAARQRVPPREHRPLVRPAHGGASPDNALHPVPDHEVEARGLALTIGCQHSNGRLSGFGTRVISSSS